MLPFHFEPRPGVPIYEQIIFAVKRALVSGRMKPGDPFPSLRQLSRELQINPNTAQKVVRELIHAGLLESHPGIGTVLCSPPPLPVREIQAMLKSNLDSLVVEAMQLGLSKDDLLAAVNKTFEKMQKPRQP